MISAKEARKIVNEYTSRNISDKSEAKLDKIINMAVHIGCDGCRIRFENDIDETNPMDINKFPISEIEVILAYLKKEGYGVEPVGIDNRLNQVSYSFRIYW